jgi:hypothetical protein
MIDHRRIFEIACALKPLHDETERIFNELLHASCDVVAYNESWEKSIRAYQDALLGYANAIAAATNNSANNMRMLFRAHDRYTILWTPQDLLNVARFESFSRYAWNHPGASVRNEYEFPTEHV